MTISKEFIDEIIFTLECAEFSNNYCLENVQSDSYYETFSNTAAQIHNTLLQLKYERNII